MPDVNVVAVLAATVAAFGVGGAYYTAFGEQSATAGTPAPARTQVPRWTYAIELIRCLILAAVVAGLASRGQVERASGGLLLGLALWIGFPLVLWAGAMLHERTPLKLAAIHAGDWFLKLLVVAVIVSV